MTWLILILASAVLGVLYGFVKDYRRIKQLRFMARAERATAKFGDVRHMLVLAYARGEIRPEDQKAFSFIHQACTQVLHAPDFFREVSTAICLSIAGDKVRRPKDSITGRDLSAVTRPALEQFVQAMDELIEQFAHPLLAAFAAMNGVRVLEFVVRARDARREIDRRRRTLEELRRCGAAALAA